MKKRILAIVLAVGMMAALTACGASKSEMSYDGSADYDGSAENGYVDGDFESGYENSDFEGPLDNVRDDTGEVNYGEKLIKTYNYTIQSSKYDEAKADIEKLVKEYGGYIENQTGYNYDYGKNTYFTLRIPADKAEEFLSKAGNAGTITEQSIYVEDVTSNYIDVEAHLKAVKIQHERLLELLEQAESLEDIIALEERLTEIEYQLGSYESTLKNYDNQVKYATIYLNLNEISETEVVEEDGVLERIRKGFTENLGDVGTGLVDIMVGIIVALPYIVVLGILAFVLILLYKKFLKKHPKKERREKHEDMPVEEDSKEE